MIDEHTLLSVSINKVGEKAKIVSTSVDSVFKAEVLEIGNGYILVKPEDGTREASSSDRIEVSHGEYGAVTGTSDRRYH